MPFQNFSLSRFTLVLFSLLLAACAADGSRSRAFDPDPLSGGQPSVMTTSPAAISPEAGPVGGIAAQPDDTADKLQLPRNASHAVFFQRGSAVLDAAALAVLRIHADRLRENPRLVVTLVGHTDHLGSRSFNLAIAERRIAAVKSRLREFGVPARQIRERSYGHEQPGMACQGEACRHKMRRVDLLYPKPRAERRIGEPSR